MSKTESQSLNSAIIGAVQQATAAGLDSGGIWRAACDAVVAYRLAKVQPFTSGEVAAILRTFDPKLNFSVGSVGSRLREAFFAGEFTFDGVSPEIAYDDFGNPDVDDNGNQLYVAADGSGTTAVQALAATVNLPNTYVQVSRYCEGLGRTPAGVEVYCYAPDYSAGEAHDFEVNIPAPSTVPVVNPTTGVPDVPVAKVSTRDPNTDDGQRATQVAKADARGDLVCTVQDSGRMNLGRPVLEHYCLLTRQALASDATIYVWVNGDTLTCRLQDDAANPAAARYQVFRGRTLINLPRLGVPRNPGLAVNAEVTASGILIPL